MHAHTHTHTHTHTLTHVDSYTNGCTHARALFLSHSIILFHLFHPNGLHFLSHFFQLLTYQLSITHTHTHTAANTALMLSGTMLMDKAIKVSHSKNPIVKTPVYSNTRVRAHTQTLPLYGIHTHTYPTHSRCTHTSNHTRLTHMHPRLSHTHLFIHRRTHTHSLAHTSKN